MSPPLAHRQSFTTTDILHDIWTQLNLPTSALTSVHLPNADNSSPAVPSSFKIGPLAQATIALSALAARLVRSTRLADGVNPFPAVSVPLEHAVVEFNSNALYTLESGDTPLPRAEHILIGGLHRTADGYVRIHDVFPHHVARVLRVLGLPMDAAREEVAKRVALWKKLDLEKQGLDAGAAVYALRSVEEWDAHPQSVAIDSNPILLRRIHDFPVKNLPPRDSTTAITKCLSGLKVLELDRVIAGPVAGKTLAAHGADVLWVTSPWLPALPALDIDLSRGKRNINLDLHSVRDRRTLMDLIRDCDVFIQGYRPGSLSSHGLSPRDLIKLNPNIIYANMSAFGPSGPWSRRRGFDSLVQACSGMNVSEAEYAGEGQDARVLPCQALDHASGYLLATGIMAAVYHGSVSGGAWEVDVSLGGTMKLLRSLGRYPGQTGFERTGYGEVGGLSSEMVVTTETAFGRLTAVRHSAGIEGCEVGWELMPCPPGENEPVWR